MKPFFSFLLFLAVAGCSNPPRLEKDYGLVKVYERPPALPHTSSDRYLEFKGKRYHHFRAFGYVLLPSREAIVFCTEPKMGWTRFHYVPITAGDEITLDVKVSGLAVNFGDSKYDRFSDFIETEDGKKITFIERNFSERNGHRYSVDFATRSYSDLGAR